MHVPGGSTDWHQQWLFNGKVLTGTEMEQCPEERQTGGRVFKILYASNLTGGICSAAICIDDFVCIVPLYFGNTSLRDHLAYGQLS